MKTNAKYKQQQFRENVPVKGIRRTVQFGYSWIITLKSKKIEFFFTNVLQNVIFFYKCCWRKGFVIYCNISA